MNPLLTTRLDDGVFDICLNRPQRLNALTLAMSQALLEAVQTALADPHVRVLLLRAEGRAFCAGKDRDDPPSPAFVDTLQTLAGCLVNAPQPVVCAVQGWAVGAGMELMLNADLVLAAQSARFALPEVAVGLFGTGGIAALLPRLVGLQKAKGLLMLGSELDAPQAERLGLVWAVVEDAELLPRAQALAHQLAASDPRLLAEIKRLVHQENIGDFGAALAREAAVHARLQAR